MRMLVNDHVLHGIVSHLAEPATRDAAASVLARAKTLAARHTRTGGFAESFRMEQGEWYTQDWTVVSVHPLAIAIECGHLAPNGSWVRGLHILRNAALG